MPTPAGKPKIGERISYGVPLPMNNWKPEIRYGTVVARGTGDYWTLYVRWDGVERAPRPSFQYGKDVDMMLDAAYALKQGWLKVIG